MNPNHAKVLYVLNALLFCALLASFLYQNYVVGQSAQTVSSGNMPAQSDQVTVDAIAKVTVGSNSDNPAAKRLGLITQINGDSLTLKEQPGGAVYQVSISYSTKVELLGERKSPAEYQKELDAYYAQVKLLIQNPIKNKEALGALTLPPTNESKLGSITDFAVGDSIIAIADASITDKNFVAVKIIKAMPAGQ